MKTELKYAVILTVDHDEPLHPGVAFSLSGDMEHNRIYFEDIIQYYGLNAITMEVVDENRT